MGTPAPFWRRYAAYSLDVAIVLALALAPLAWLLRAFPTALRATMDALQMRIWELFDASLQDATLAAGTTPWQLSLRWATDPVLRARFEDLAGLLTRATLLTAAIVMAIAALWFVGFEASRRQATPGKALLGLRVTDLTGGRPSPGRVALRFVAGVPSWLLLHLGHAMAAWTKEKRALHDLIAGTRVQLREGVEPRLPPWARAWLLLQAAAFFGLSSFVLLSYARLLVEAASGGLG